MKRILILQNVIMEYRRPVYNGLAEWYDVTVLHSGQPTVTAVDRYKEITTRETKIGPFDIHPPGEISRLIGDYDTVIAMFGVRTVAFWLPLLGRKRPKYILWGHWYSGRPLGDAVRDWLMKKADGLLLYGDEEVEKMVDRGVDRSKISIAWNTTHVPNHKDYSSAAKSSILFVGRLRPLKMIDKLIGIFAKLQGRIGDDVILDIVGSGEDQANLKNMAANLGIAHKVRFHGTIDDPDTLATLFSRAYAYVSPGHVGLGALHSFAYGIPVLTNRIQERTPEYYNLKEGENMLFFDDFDGAERTIERICTEPGLAARLGRNAYLRYVEERPLDRMLAGFRQAIDH